MKRSGSTGSMDNSPFQIPRYASCFSTILHIIIYARLGILMFGWKFGRKENDDRIMPVHVRIGAPRKYWLVKTKKEECIKNKVESVQTKDKIYWGQTW